MNTSGTAFSRWAAFSHDGALWYRMLRTVKTSNATAGHHGEMAWQQMFMVDKPF